MSTAPTWDDILQAAADLRTTDTTQVDKHGALIEPAVPIIAPVPLSSLRSLLDVAAQDWPTLDEPGAQVAMHVDARGVGVAAQFTVHDWEGRLLGRRTYDGQWEVGGSVTWRPGR